MPSMSMLIAVSCAALFSSFLFAASASEDRFSGIFIISDITVSNDEAYQRYRAKVKPVIENCGGTYVVRAGAKFVTDNPSSGLLNSSGGWNPDRIVVLNFTTEKEASECFNSDDYKAAYALREGGTSGRSLIVNAYRPDD